MKIKTKFNAGDTVWIKEFNSEAKKFMPESWQIDHINIKISKYGNVETRYYLGWWQGISNMNQVFEELLTSLAKNDNLFRMPEK